MFRIQTGARGTAPLLRSVWLLIGLCLLFVGCGAEDATESTDSEWLQTVLSGPTMGTSYQIKVVHLPEKDFDPDSLGRTVDSELVRFNQILSTYDPESEISRFNAHRSLEPFPVSREMLAVTEESARLHEESGGAFDPTVGPLVELWGFGRKGRRQEPPSATEIEEAIAYVGMDLISTTGEALVKSTPKVEVDFSAIAKGYGVDRIGEVLEAEGFRDFMVEIGGEVVLRGRNQSRLPWTIGVDSPDQKPGEGRNLIDVLSLTDCAVATSGDYRNVFEWEGVPYSHLIDPRTGRPIPESVKSVTVVAPTCMLADGAATAIAAMGAEKGVDWAESRGDLEVLVFVRDHEGGFRRIQTTGMNRYLKKEMDRAPVLPSVGENE